MPYEETLEALRIRLRLAWTRDTSAMPNDWRTANPAIGQCAVTALVVQDTFGGRLMRCLADGTVSHYFNELSSGEIVDLTREQFPPETHFGDPEERSRDYVLGFPATHARYHALLKRIAYQ